MLEDGMTEAVLADWRTAEVSDRLRAGLSLVEVLTLRPQEIGPSDIGALREQGVSDAGIECVIHVCAAFNVIDRMADALEFHVPSQERFRLSASVLLKRGYKI